MNKLPREALIELLTVSLEGAVEQLEGWIVWKCPARHKAEHEAYVQKLRDAIALAKAQR